MNIIIFIFIVTFVAGSIIWCFTRKYRYNKFQKNMEPHDQCIFYKGYTKCYGVLITVEELNVTLLDGNCDVYYRPKQEVYPVL